MRNNSETKRLANIDIYKAIGIILMIMGHIGFGKDFRYYIAAFHMPMFFFISGYLFKAGDFKTFLIRKFKALIIPYLIWGGINAITCSLIYNHFKFGRYLEKMFWFNNEPPLPICGAIWFLTCLFFVNIIFYLLYRYCRKYILEFVILLLVALEFILKIRLPWSLDSAIFMLPVFYAGLKFKQNEPILNQRPGIWISLIIFVITIFTIKANGYVNTRMNLHSDLFLFYFNSLLMSIAIFYVSKELVKLKFINFIKQVGEKSLDYMCSHQIILKILLINGIKFNWELLALVLVLVNIFIFTKVRCKALFAKIVNSTQPTV